MSRDRERAQIAKYLNGGCRVGRKIEKIRDNGPRHRLCATNVQTAIQSVTSSVRRRSIYPGTEYGCTSWAQ